MTCEDGSRDVKLTIEKERERGEGTRYMSCDKKMYVHAHKRKTRERQTDRMIDSQCDRADKKDKEYIPYSTMHDHTK